MDVESTTKTKRTVEDSVFTNLFGNSKYLLQLYQFLHPEDADCKKGDIVNQYKNILREYLENKESEVVDIMMQLYDQEEIMRVHIQSERRNSGIMNVVIALREVGFPFSEIVNKIAKQFNLSQEKAEEEVKVYWKE